MTSQKIIYQTFSINIIFKKTVMKFLFKILLPASLFISSIFSTAISQTSKVKYHPNPIIGLVDGNQVTFEDLCPGSKALNKLLDDYK